MLTKFARKPLFFLTESSSYHKSSASFFFPSSALPFFRPPMRTRDKGVSYLTFTEFHSEDIVRYSTPPPFPHVIFSLHWPAWRLRGVCKQKFSPRGTIGTLSFSFTFFFPFHPQQRARPSFRSSGTYFRSGRTAFEAPLLSKTGLYPTSPSRCLSLLKDRSESLVVAFSPLFDPSAKREIFS